MRKLWEEIPVMACVVTPFRTGDIVVICGKRFRVFGWSRAFDTNITVTRVLGLWFHPVLALYRLCESVRFTGKYLIVLLSIWKLADWSPATMPHWRSIHILARLAKVFARKTETLSKEETGNG